MIAGIKILSSLLDFEYVIKKTIEGIERYEEFRIRSRIELFFKVAKAMFGLRDLHVYTKYAITEIRMIFCYTALLPVLFEEWDKHEFC